LAKTQSIKLKVAEIAEIRDGTMSTF